MVKDLKKKKEEKNRSEMKFKENHFIKKRKERKVEM